MGMTAAKFEAENVKFTIPPDKFAKLLVELNKISHGRVTIFMQDGEPVRIEEKVKSIKL